MLDAGVNGMRNLFHLLQSEVALHIKVHLDYFRFIRVFVALVRWSHHLQELK